MQRLPPPYYALYKFLTVTTLLATKAQQRQATYTTLSDLPTVAIYLWTAVIQNLA